MFYQISVTLSYNIYIIIDKFVKKKEDYKMPLLNSNCALCNRPVGFSNLAMTLADKNEICGDCAKRYNIPVANSWGWPNKTISRWADEHNISDLKRLLHNHANLTTELFNSQLLETQIEMQIANVNHSLGGLSFKKCHFLAKTLDIDHGEYITYIADGMVRKHDSDVSCYIVFTNTRMLIIEDNLGLHVWHEVPLKRLTHVKHQSGFITDKLYIKTNHGWTLNDYTFLIKVYSHEDAREIIRLVRHHAKASEGISYQEGVSSENYDEDDTNKNEDIHDIGHINQDNDDDWKAQTGQITEPSVNDLIDQQTPIQNTINHVHPIDPADEIRKFKKLEEDGIITKEEFEAKKKQLLDL